MEIFQEHQLHFFMSCKNMLCDPDPDPVGSVPMLLAFIVPDPDIEDHKITDPTGS